MLIPVLALLVLVVLGLMGLYGAQQMTRPPRWVCDDDLARWDLPPPERVWLRSRDGLRLAAWWFGHPDARASVVVCHGHGCDKRTSLWVAADLHPALNVLLLDVRGHGESDGDRTSVGFFERLDILGAVDWVLERLGPSRIGLVGISMGGAAVIQAAAECPAVAAVVADSSFARLRSPVREAICARGYPRPLAPLLAWSVCTVASLLGPPRGRWRDPIDVIGRIGPRPLLLIHGQADDLIPVENAHALFRRTDSSAELWIVPEAGHARAAEIAPSAYADRVRRFFERWLLAPEAEQSASDSQPAPEAGAGHGQDVGERQLQEVERG